jgi:XTP/dITP diphosphohydrolase
LIEKLLYRAKTHDVELEIPQSMDGLADESAVGQALLSVIAWAHANGIDAEAALRKQAAQVSAQIAAIEAR